MKDKPFLHLTFPESCQPFSSTRNFRRPELNVTSALSFRWPKRNSRNLLTFFPVKDSFAVSKARPTILFAQSAKSWKKTGENKKQQRGQRNIGKNSKTNNNNNKKRQQYETTTTTTISDFRTEHNMSISLNFNIFFSLIFFLSLPHYPIKAKKVSYWGEREHGFRCYSCVTGSSDWSKERCNPRIDPEVYSGCGNGTSGCFKWIVNSGMTVRGCGVNFLVEKEEEDEKDEEYEEEVKTFDFDKQEYPSLADMCRNLTRNMFSGKRLRRRTPQNILTILAHSNVNKFEHEKYIKIFNETCTRILERSQKFESGLMARRRPPAGQLKYVKFCKWYDACNGTVDPSLRISLFLLACVALMQITLRC